MAKSRIYIPEEVKSDIRKHLTERYEHALDGYDSAREEEDALTGDMGASFRARNRRVSAVTQKESKGDWVWSITYKKVRGRGPHPTENIIGADGLFELTVQSDGYIEHKSLLFQAKIDWKNDPNLFEQSLKLSNWREAAFLLNFKEGRIEAIDLDTAVRSQGRMPSELASVRIDEYIGNNFLNCDVGDRELFYDVKGRKLRWKAMNGDIVSTHFLPKHLISINVTSPEVKEWFGREISHDEIFRNRMEASPEDLLALKPSPTKDDVKKAHALMAKTYHTDTLIFPNDLSEKLANDRMQEINHAADILKAKFKKT